MSLTPTVPPGPKSRSPWLLPLALGFLLVGLLATTPIGNYDLGTDLKTGQWILSHHAFPGKDTFTYTCNQRDYLDGKVLYQVLLYLGYRLAGYRGLSLANTLCVLLVFGLLALRLKWAGSPPWLTLLLLTACAIAMERRFFLRSEILSWVLLSLTLAVLELRARGRESPLRVLPVIQWAWANIEGLFMLGWAVMGAHVLGSWLERRRPDRRLLAAGGLSVALTLVNPYGPKLWFLPFLYLSEFKGSVNSDLVSPLKFLAGQNLALDWNPQVFLYFALSALLALSMALSWRKRRAHEWLLSSFFFYLSCAAYRNIPLFLLVSVPILAESLRDVARLSYLKRAAPPPAILRKAPLLAALLLLLLDARVVTGAYYASNRRPVHLGLGLDRGQIPVRAVDFLNRNHLEGRMLNYIGMGDWLIWRWNHPVFIDGRQQVVGPGLYDQYKQSFFAGGLARLILLYRPDLIALNYNDDVPWAVQLKLMPDWRLLYADGSTALYARQGYAPGLPAFDFSSALGRYGIRPDLARDQELARDTRPARWKAWLGGFDKLRRYPMGLMSLGLFALHYGDYRSSESLFAEALRRAGGGYAEIFFNLGVDDLHLGLYPAGKLCLEKSLALGPGNPAAQRMLAELHNF